MMLTLAAQIILLLVIIGGAIAYIGNRVGKYIGKKRLTIFNLRPRYTATAITIVSGILIALSTMGILLAVSQDARTAILGLDRLKQEISQKSEELSGANEALSKLNRELDEKLKQQKELEEKLNASKKETAQLESIKHKLSREVTVARQGELVFKKGEVITLSLIQAGPEKDKIEAGLRSILSAAEESLRGQGIKTAVSVAAEDLDQTVYELLGQSKIFIVKLVATSNVVWGESIPARFELAENKLIYAAGQEIASGDIAAGLPSAQVEQEVIRILRLSHQTAREAGILPDAAGSVGSIPYSQVYDLARKIKSLGKKVSLKVLAKKDIFTIGPLEVDFKFNYK